MSTRTKILIALGVCLLLVGVVILVKYLRDVNERQKEIETSVVQMRQLQDGIVRSESTYATKEDIEKFAKSSGVDLKPIQADLEKLDAKIAGISSVRVVTVGVRESNVNSSSTARSPEPVVPIRCENGVCKDEYGYRSNIQYLELREPFPNGAAVPFGQAGFSAWKKAPWSVRVAPREYSITTVVSRDEDGRSFFHHRFVIGVDGKKYVIPISDSKFVEEYPIAGFHFDPALFLMLGAGYAGEFEVAPGVQFSLLSYGVTKDRPVFSLANVGLGYLINGEDIGIMFTPIYWNVGGSLPLVENTYIGPGMSFGFDGKIGFFGKVAVQF
jgi:hypothetical protein